MTLFKASEVAAVGAMKTGTFLDRMTGINGLPIGRITEIYGDSGAGKSSICLQIVANAQKQGIKCLWIDSEWSYSGKYEESLGVNNGELTLIRGECAEEVLEDLNDAIEEEYKLIVLDSVGGLTPRQEIEKGVEGKVIGAQANLVARLCRRIVPVIATKGIVFIVINHSVVDIMNGRDMSSGGKKLEYHKSLSIHLRHRGMSVKQGEKKIGKTIVATVKKNKLAATEGLSEEVDIIFGAGFSNEADTLDEALRLGVITKNGNTYFFASEKIGIGMNKTRDALKDEKLMERVKHAIEGA